MKDRNQGATLTVDQAHAMVGKKNISRNAFYAAVRRGDVPSLRWGKRLLIPRERFEKLLASGELQ